MINSYSFELASVLWPLRYKLSEAEVKALCRRAVRTYQARLKTWPKSVLALAKKLRDQAV